MKTTATWCACLAALSLFSLSDALRADAVFPSFNQSALARSTALPVLGNTSVEPVGQNEFLVSMDWTNEYYDNCDPTRPVCTANEQLIIDGETQQLMLGVRRGLWANFDVGLAVPILFTDGGALDGLIQGWHHTFGLPNAGRQLVPSNRFHYLYMRNGATLVNDDQAASGLGDVRLTAGWQVADQLTVRSLIKLPTGDNHEFTGGNFGTAVWVDYDPFAQSRRWFGFLSAGGSYSQRGGNFSQLQTPVVGFGGAGAGFRLLPRLSALGQVDINSPLHHGSQLNPLELPGIQILAGGRYDFSARTALNFGIEEKLIYGSSPDFGFHFSIVIR